MEVLYLLIPLALILAGGAVASFFWAVRHNQYVDTTTPAIRILLDDPDVSEDPSPPRSSRG